MYLGIEFGSTRIKATAIDENYKPIANSGYTWQSKFENGIWTYDLNEAFEGLKAALAGEISRLSTLGIS